MRLTKSEYMMGRTCPTKIAHMRNHLPTTSEKDPMMRERAAVGAIVHWMAPQMYSNTVYGKTLADIKPGEYGTYSEVVSQSSDRYARFDILRYTTSELKIVEFKSEKLPTNHKGEYLRVVNEHGEIRSEWLELLHDLTFQCVVLLCQHAEDGLELLNDDVELRAELVLLNHEYESTTNDLRQRFSVDPKTQDVRFDGNLDELLGAGILIPVDVTDIIRMIIEDVYIASGDMIATIAANRPPTLSKACARCEFRTRRGSDQPESGFEKCWGDLATQTPFILDLTEVGRLTPIDGRDAVTSLTSKGLARTIDIPIESFTTRFNNKQHRQVISESTSSALIDRELVETLAAHPYPHVFIDVEAVNSAFPMWPSTRPYEITMFQWSAHVIAAPGELPVHDEWLHLSHEHPCMDALTSLRECTRNAGTIYIYSSYERTAVKHAAAIAERMGRMDEATREWVAWFLDDANPVVVDLLRLARHYYMHPDLKGSSSIKDVLPTVWKSSQLARAVFPEYVRVENGELMSPYAALPKLYGVANVPDVRDGNAAVNAYMTLMYDTSLSDDNRRVVHAALLEYCKLDTAAMVIIALGWGGHDHRGDTT